MDDPETAAERRERFLRLVAHLTEQLREGKDPARLREQLVVAIMMAPVLAAEAAVLLGDFDAAAARADQRA
jgi:hypothetical protein